MIFKYKEGKHQGFVDSVANRIGQGAIIEGVLSSESDIRVDGRIKGIIQCGAKVVIGQTGELIGDIQCKEAAIEGRIMGKVEVNGLLSLKSTAVIEGDIYYKRLIVEEGAIIIGTLIMSGGTTKNLVINQSEEAKSISHGSTQTA